MNYIEKALGRPIERISTEDTDEMEKVTTSLPCDLPNPLLTIPANRFYDLP